MFFDPETGVSGDLSLVSDYLFRGETLSEGRAVIQGGLDYNYPQGLFLGTWFSAGGKASASEIDVYGGYIAELAQEVDIIVDFAGYIYPHASADNSLEGSITIQLHEAQIAY